MDYLLMRPRWEIRSGLLAVELGADRQAFCQGRRSVAWRGVIFSEGADRRGDIWSWRKMVELARCLSFGCFLVINLQNTVGDRRTYCSDQRRKLLDVGKRQGKMHGDVLPRSRLILAKGLISLPQLIPRAGVISLLGPPPLPV